MGGMLFPPLPQATTQTFWLNAAMNFVPGDGGYINAKGETDFLSFNLPIGMFRVTKIVFSGNWPEELYRQNAVHDRTIFSNVGTNKINILSKKTRRQFLSYPLASEMYFDLDWVDYFEVNQSDDSLVFSIDQLLNFNEEEIQFGYFKAILGIQLQHFTDSRWEEAIRLGKV